MKRSLIIQRLSQFLVGDPGVLDGIGRVGVAELSLNRCDVAGLLDEVPAHGVAGVMGRVALDAGKAAYLVEHGIDHPRVEPAVAVGVGGCGKKQRRRLPFFIFGGSFFGHIILDRGYPLPRNLIPVRAAALFIDIGSMVLSFGH